MGLERTEYASYSLVSFGSPFKCSRDIVAGFHDNRNDYVPKSLAGCLPHNPPNGLNYVHLTVARIEECNSV